MQTNKHIAFKTLITGIFFYLLISTTPNKLTISALNAQQNHLIFSDGEFNSGDWVVFERIEFGTSQTHTQELSGGHPGAYRAMQHILPAPESSMDNAIIHAIHIYQGDSYDPSKGPIAYIDYSEDMKLLDLPYSEAFITSYMAIEQDGVFYYSVRYNRLIGETTWQTKTQPGLVASNFPPIFDPTSSKRPDFSESGSPIKFGYYRASGRMRSIPIYPVDQILVYNHAIDNWRVTLHGELGNLPPVAQDDAFVLKSIPQTVYPLSNDNDPNGDNLIIEQVLEPAVRGEIISYDDYSILYEAALYWYSEFEQRVLSDFFYYVVTDGEFRDTAKVVMAECSCLLNAMFLKQCSNFKLLRLSKSAAALRDSVDLYLFYQLRNEVLESNENGRHIIDTYYKNADEILEIVLADPDLQATAISTISMLAEPISSLIQGDSSAIISQTLVDTLKIFLNKLSSVGSQNLKAAISEEMDRLGPLDDYVGQTVKQAKTTAIGDSVSTSNIPEWKPIPTDYALFQNYPNPFNQSTKICYDLPQKSNVVISIYNVMGQKVSTLVQGWQPAGSYSRSWDAKDDNGLVLPSGVYLLVMQADKFKENRKILLLK